MNKIPDIENNFIENLNLLNLFHKKFELWKIISQKTQVIENLFMENLNY